MSNDLKPVWIAFPNIPWGSIGWRMGWGEKYWLDWIPWFESLSAEARANYKHSWPEPPEWEGFYTFVETGSPPPWFVEKQRLIAEAAIPPAADETEITGYHRILWLLRQYMHKDRSDLHSDNEILAELYSAPDGSRWRLSAASTGGMKLRRLA